MDIQGKEHFSLSSVKGAILSPSDSTHRVCSFTYLSEQITKDVVMATVPYPTLHPISLFCLFFFFFLASIVFKVVVISTKIGTKLPACVVIEILSFKSEDLILDPDCSV